MNVPAVYAAVAAVQAELAKEGISKSRRNQQQGFNFRGIDDVYAAVAHLLPTHGLTMFPRMISRETDTRQTAKGGNLYFVTVEAEFDFVAVADGSKHTARTFGEASDSGDKATNKAMSAAQKYAVLMTFTVPTEGDNDADAHTPEPTVQRQMVQPAAFLDRWERMLALADNRDALAKLWEETKQERADVKAQDAAASAAVVDKFKARSAAVQANAPAANDTPTNHQTIISAG